MKHIVRRLKSKISETGFKNCMIGTFKMAEYWLLQKKYHYDKWHISPYELRPYLQAAAACINNGYSRHIRSLGGEGRTSSAAGHFRVLDLGCGLGELLRKFDSPVIKIGHDANPEPIKAAEYLCRHVDNITFQVGSFDTIEYDYPIDYFVALGFLHGSREEIWADAFRKLCQKNVIRHFIVDTFPEDETTGTHALSFRNILPDQYVLAERMGPYTAGRYLEIWRSADVPAEF